MEHSKSGTKVHLVTSAVKGSAILQETGTASLEHLGSKEMSLPFEGHRSI